MFGLIALTNCALRLFLLPTDSRHSLSPVVVLVTIQRCARGFGEIFRSPCSYAGLAVVRYTMIVAVLLLDACDDGQDAAIMGVVSSCVRSWPRQPTRSIPPHTTRHWRYEDREDSMYVLMIPIISKICSDERESASGPAARELPACSSEIRAERVKCAEPAESAMVSGVGADHHALLDATLPRPSSLVRGSQSRVAR